MWLLEWPRLKKLYTTAANSERAARRGCFASKKSGEWGSRFVRQCGGKVRKSKSEPPRRDLGGSYPAEASHIVPQEPLVPVVTAWKLVLRLDFPTAYSEVPVELRFALRAATRCELVIAISAAHCGAAALVPPTWNQPL